MSRHAGPAADATWEYHAARQPRSMSALTIDDVTLDRDELVVAFTVDNSRERIDAVYFHPKWAELDGDRSTLTLFLMLDGALGEDGVERWLGTIDAADEPPANGVAFAAFTAAVDELARTATGQKFALLRGESDTGPILVTVNRALKRIDHLLDTTRLVVDLAIAGMPTNAEAEQLDALEDELAAQLGGLAVYIGRETRAGHRLLSWYMAEDSAARAIVERWAAAHADRQPQIAAIPDPTWEYAKRFA